MRAIFKREFRSLMLSVRGIVFLGVFLLAAGIFTAVYNFNAALANFEIALSYLVPVLVLTVPLLCADAFADEREKGTEGVLRMLPLRLCDVIFGKFLARLCVLFVSCGVLALYPLILDLYGTVSYATAYVTLFALLCLGAILIAVGMFISSFSKTVLYARVWAYIAFAIWYAIGILCALLPSSWYVLEEIVTFLSPFRAFDDFVFGVLDFGILVQYGIWIALFLFLTAVCYERKRGVVHSRLLRSGWLRRMSAAVLSLCLVGGAIIALCGMALLPSRVGRLDLTSAKSYTLSRETKDFLSALESEVTVFVIDPDRSDRRFEMFLDTMAGYSKKLTLRTVYTENEPSFLADHGLANATVSPYSLVVAGKDREQFVAYENLFSYSNETLGVTDMTLSTYQYYLYTFQSNSQYSQYLATLLADTVQYFEGETILAALIEYAAAPEIPTVYLLEGFGTATSESMAAYVMAYYGVEYKAFSFGEIPVVPTDAASLVLAKPQRDLSAAEADAIRSYLGQGGQLTVLTNESNLEMQNLCALLAEYGMTASVGSIAETVAATEEGAEATETTTLTVTPNFQHDMLAAYADSSDFSVSVTDANAIHYPQNPAGSLIVTPLLTTSTQSYVQGMPETKGSRCVAAAAETAEGARVAWFTAADSFLGDLSKAPTSRDVNNALCVLLAAEWSTKTYQSEITPAPHKPYTSEWMTVGEGAAAAWGVIFIVLIPAAFVSFGLVKRYGRKKAK